MIGLTLGTGVGGVVAVDGQVLQGYKGRAGELGHQTIDPDGPMVQLRQPRLRRGVLSGRPDRHRLRHGERRGGGRGARAPGDDGPSTGLAEIGRYLGIGLANMIVALNAGPGRAGRRRRGRRRAHPRAHPGRDRATRPRDGVSATSTWSSRAGDLRWRHRRRRPRRRARRGARSGGVLMAREWLSGRLVLDDEVMPGRLAIEDGTDRRPIEPDDGPGERTVPAARLRRRPRPRLGRPRRDGRPRRRSTAWPDALLRRGVTSFLPTGVTVAAAGPRPVRGDGARLDARGAR